MSGVIAHTNLVLVGLTLSRLLRAVDGAPEFPPAGIVRGDRTVETLVPGVGMSIYGRYLGPGTGCVGRADQKQVETPNPRAVIPAFADVSVCPKELCDVQVLIGAEPAGLLYVSEKQINFKVPQDKPESGTVELRVVYRGRSSAPLEMKAGFEKTTISLDQPAYTDMPVWLRVSVPFEFAGMVRYPFVLGPAGFGCTEVEVRRNGQPLPLLPGANSIRFGTACLETSAAVISRLRTQKRQTAVASTLSVRHVGHLRGSFCPAPRPMDCRRPGEIRAQFCADPDRDSSVETEPTRRLAQ